MIWFGVGWDLDEDEEEEVDAGSVAARSSEGRPWDVLIDGRRSRVGREGTACVGVHSTSENSDSCFEDDVERVQVERVEGLVSVS